jgi:hypothetical protein
MKAIPSELEFISQINRDGSGVTPVSEEYLKAMLTNSLMNTQKYKLYRLSITEKTYIACGFNSFVVRLKSEK